MKDDLIITRFKTEPIIGTKETRDVKTFFGSKMVKIEDTILIDNSNIQYSEVFNATNQNNNGYQYFKDNDNIEKIRYKNLSDLKLNNHDINLVSQPEIDLKNNTQWLIKINWKNILIEYIFYQLKKMRTFKCIKYTDILNENINLYIKEYIKENLLNRYEFSELNFYIEYFDLEDGDENIDPNLLFNPIFDINVKNEGNRVKNINAIKSKDFLNINYKQTKSSEEMKFNYYFDIIFNKI